MSSSKVNDGRSRRGVAAAVLVDPESVLLRESGPIVDPHFLAALCQELTANVGAENAGAALLQIGCLHGLRDAELVVSATLAAPSAQACAPSSPVLPLRLRTRPQSGPDGSIEIEGIWPEAAEAQAWLSHQPAADGPVCAMSAGYTSGWLSSLFEADVIAVETACSAAGAERCRFVARDRASWVAAADSYALALAAELPIEELREALEEPTDGEPIAGSADETLIHIWGPVMVVPFIGLEESLQAVELLRTDPSACRVSVIVLDLTGALLDEAFGAAALEQIIETGEACGAETVLAGVSSLSEAVVTALEPQPILVCKDLHAGIAAGFQVADSQQRLL